MELSKEPSASKTSVADTTFDFDSPSKIKNANEALPERNKNMSQIHNTTKSTLQQKQQQRKRVLTMIRNLFKRKVNPHVATEADERKTAPPENVPVAETIENRPATPILGDIDHDSQIKLGIEKHLFSHIGDSVPILSTITGEHFQGLEIRGDVFQHGDVVLEKADTHIPVAVIERKYAPADNTFTIYTTSPVYSGEEPASIFKYNVRLYHFAEVKHDGKVWKVVLEGQTEPTYTIHKLAPQHRHFPTKHTVMKGENEVAYMRYSEGNAHSFVLVIDEGVDATLMILLSIIADEVDK